MAANVSLKPTARFDFKLPDEWPKWKRRFQQYLTATGLDKENDAQKVSTLSYCLGEESDDVLTSTEHERENDEAVIEKFDTFFKGRRHERARSNRRDQMEEVKNPSLVCTAWSKPASTVLSRKRCSEIDLS